MKWEKEKLDEIDEAILELNKLKVLANDKLKQHKEKLKTITDELPEYIELYKKMKGQL
jgi:hemerythrin